MNHIVYLALAASLLESSESRFEHRTSVANAKRLVYLKLMENYQNTDPFKFIIYSGKIGEQHRSWPVASDEMLSRLNPIVESWHLLPCPERITGQQEGTDYFLFADHSGVGP